MSFLLRAGRVCYAAAATAGRDVHPRLARHESLTRFDSS